MIEYALEDKVQLKNFIVDRTLRAMDKYNLNDYRSFIRDEVSTHSMLTEKEISYITKASVKLVENQLNSDTTNECAT